MNIEDLKPGRCEKHGRSYGAVVCGQCALDMVEDLDAAKDESAKLRELLSESQWADTDCDGIRYCAECGNAKERGHDNGCELAAALNQPIDPRPVLA